jgi:hypothetical protein
MKTRRYALTQNVTLYDYLADDGICGGNTQVFGIGEPVTVIRRGRCKDGLHRVLTGVTDYAGKPWYGWLYAEQLAEPVEEEAPDTFAHEQYVASWER